MAPPNHWSTSKMDGQFTFKKMADSHGTRPTHRAFMSTDLKMQKQVLLPQPLQPFPNDRFLSVSLHTVGCSLLISGNNMHLDFSEHPDPAPAYGRVQRSSHRDPCPFPFAQHPNHRKSLERPVVLSRASPIAFRGSVSQLQLATAFWGTEPGLGQWAVRQFLVFNS